MDERGGGGEESYAKCREHIFNIITTEKFPNPGKEGAIQAQETHGMPNGQGLKRTPHIT